MFGARGVGKSSILKNQFFKRLSNKSSTNTIIWIDLLLSNQEVKYAASPSVLYQEIKALTKPPKWVVIDEVQKVPELLDIVHKLIEEKKIKFALTGSSARKLKRNQANLLAGRAFVYRLFPLTSLEMGKKFDLKKVLTWGSLPKIFSYKSDLDKTIYLESYCETYLKEEVLVEQLVRKLPPFRKFLEIAAQMNGEEINYSNIGKDLRVDYKTVENYYSIIEDTLLGFTLPAYATSIRKQQSKTPKFYLFDIGVKRCLENTLDLPIKAGSPEYGRAFEHFLIAEIYRLNIYCRKNYSLSYFRSKDGVEIDLILERNKQKKILIEIKSTTTIDERHVSSLKRVYATLPKEEYVAYCFSNDPISKIIDEIKVLHWQKGLEELGFRCG